jgi:hypothetical protein
MKRGNDQNIALIARRAQGIGSGLTPESDFENTSKLFICAGNKGRGAVFSITWKSSRFSLHFSSPVYDLDQSRLKRFTLAEEFIRERNGFRL